MAEEGAKGIWKGFGPTFVGYSFQGAFKYGLYEVFKDFYSNLAGEENTDKYKPLIWLAGSASAEVFADIALCPFEAVKVRMQTSIPSPYTGMLDGLRKISASEGIGGLYKGLYPLWGRQIPYTMVRIATRIDNKGPA